MRGKKHGKDGQTEAESTNECKKRRKPCAVDCALIGFALTHCPHTKLLVAADLCPDAFCLRASLAKRPGRSKSRRFGFQSALSSRTSEMQMVALRSLLIPHKAKADVSDMCLLASGHDRCFVNSACQLGLPQVVQPTGFCSAIATPPRNDWQAAHHLQEEDTVVEAWCYSEGLRR